MFQQFPWGLQPSPGAHLASKLHSYTIEIKNHTYIHAYIHAYIHTYIHTYVRTVHTYVRTYISNGMWTHYLLCFAIQRYIARQLYAHCTAPFSSHTVPPSGVTVATCNTCLHASKPSKSTKGTCGAMYHHIFLIP